MNSREVTPHPSGRFLSITAERSQRENYLNSSNSVLSQITSAIRENGFRGRQYNLSRNILAIYYGVHFYNRVSRLSLYNNEARPPIRIYNDSADEYYISVYDGEIHINLGAQPDSQELFIHPKTICSYQENLDISGPAYIFRIIDGLEEASHLHLNLIDEKNQGNDNHRTDYLHYNKLWRKSSDDPISYRAKLWREFAAYTLIRQYLNYYVIDEYPDTVLQFNKIYQVVKDVRKDWVNHKLDKHHSNYSR